MGIVLSAQQISRVYSTGSNQATVLNNVTLSLKSSQLTAITGRSGSGKTTLLNILSGMDHPTSGNVFHGNNALHSMNEDQLAVWRGRNVGMVFQFFQLIPTLSVLENLLLPMEFCNSVPVSMRRQRAQFLLEQMDISPCANRLPQLLSGGEQQRAAIARSLANDPAIIMADEPTGNLDSANSRQVIKLLSEMALAGKTVILVTHSPEVASAADRVVVLSDGSISSDTEAVA